MGDTPTDPAQQLQQDKVLMVRLVREYVGPEESRRLINAFHHGAKIENVLGQDEILALEATRDAASSFGEKALWDSFRMLDRYGIQSVSEEDCMTDAEVAAVYDSYVSC
ncbi:MAG: hypothetical protein QGF25_05620 [Candidatus Woesearchaeota archaeon]|nr:hypothetical protein [Candidatus Woesearchaeota archaeon]MDP7467691.1 hypothetical protein [Candidatus Woesearchaeota archaeon]MDP7646775.1 hypothetical protein [Candidatus Woesearchaeota archaeon]